MKTLTKEFEFIDQLITNKRFKNARAVLAEIKNECVSEDMKAQYGLRFSESEIRLGNYLVLCELSFVVDYYRRSADHEKFARAKYCLGLVRAALGEYLDAKEALLESYTSYKRIEHFDGQARVLNYLSFLEYTSGNISSSIDYLERCIELHKRTNKPDYIILNTINLAQLYFALGNLQVSIDLYESLENKIGSMGDKDKAVFFIMSAIPPALRGNIPLSKAIIFKAIPYSTDYIREQSIYHETLGWIYNLEGNYTAGLAELTKGLKIAEDIAPESALMSQIKRRMADSYLGLNEYGQAARFVGEALAVAEKLNERVEIAECGRIRAQLACHDGDHETARENFKNAIDMFNMIGTRYNLAVCRFIAATSGLYRDGERNALLYLAREYFASEEVAHYVQKIDDEFTRRSFRVPPAPDAGNGDHPFIAVSPKTQKIVETAEMVAPSHISILLTGNTGTGKDLLAGYIHDRSGVTGQFVAINISAIPNDMVEAELFGHRKGAFTGADIDRVGLVEQAADGTLFLNEIADATPAMQAKLLEVLERMAFRRLGENEERQVSFRLLTATNQNLEELVTANTFRADLYHRIRQVEITVPCLRDRTEDIPELVRHFCGLSGIAITGNGDAEAFDTLADRLARQDWPGNVRQLKSEIEKLAVLCNRSLAAMAEAVLSESAPEDERLRALLTRHNWNRSRVARELGIGESTVRSKIKRYAISHNSHLREK